MSRIRTVALGIIVPMAVQLAMASVMEKVDTWLGLERVTFEILAIGSLLLVLILGFLYIVRSLRLGVVAGVVAGIVYFPFMIFAHFALAMFTGIEDTL